MGALHVHVTRAVEACAAFVAHAPNAVLMCGLRALFPRANNAAKVMAVASVGCAGMWGA